MALQRGDPIWIAVCEEIEHKRNSYVRDCQELQETLAVARLQYIAETGQLRWREVQNVVLAIDLHWGLLARGFAGARRDNVGWVGR